MQNDCYFNMLLFYNFFVNFSMLDQVESHSEKFQIMFRRK